MSEKVSRLAGVASAPELIRLLLETGAMGVMPRAVEHIGRLFDMSVGGTAVHNVHVQRWRV